MKKQYTKFLKITVILIALVVAVFAVFWLPYQAQATANMFPEYAFLKYPVLLGLYATIIPFFTALFLTLKLLTLIENEEAFSVKAVKILNSIKYCALIITVIYAAGHIYMFTVNAMHPGILILGLSVLFASLATGVFAGVLGDLLKNALEIKSENELTI